MKNFIQPGSVVTVTAPANVTSGDGVVVGSIFGVAAFTADSGDPVEIRLDGVFDLSADSGASTAITAGAPVYWDAAEGEVTKVGEDNLLIGVALLAKADGGTTARVRLNGSFGHPVINES